MSRLPKLKVRLPFGDASEDIWGEFLTGIIFLGSFGSGNYVYNGVLWIKRKQPAK